MDMGLVERTGATKKGKWIVKKIVLKVLQKLIILNEKVLMLLNINISKKIEKSFFENRND